jgi:hypothetical protein
MGHWTAAGYKKDHHIIIVVFWQKHHGPRLVIIFRDGIDKQQTEKPCSSNSGANIPFTFMSGGGR